MRFVLKFIFAFAFFYVFFVDNVTHQQPIILNIDNRWLLLLCIIGVFSVNFIWRRNTRIDLDIDETTLSILRDFKPTNPSHNVNSPFPKDAYYYALATIIYLLDKYYNGYWVDRLKIDLEKWRLEHDTSWYRGHFGGMGSFGDASFQLDEPEFEFLLFFLMSFTFSFADTLRDNPEFEPYALQIQEAILDKEIADCNAENLAMVHKIVNYLDDGTIMSHLAELKTTPPPRNYNEPYPSEEDE